MKLPPDVLKILETEIDGVAHGTVTLTIHLRDSHPRFVIGREQSFLPDTLTKGVDSSSCIEERRSTPSTAPGLRIGGENDNS